MKSVFGVLWLMIFLCINVEIAAQNSVREYAAVRAGKPPVIDGRLDDAIWQELPALSDFTVYSPVEGNRPKFTTEVKVVYDNDAIYVGAFMFDPAPDSIMREIGKRDDYDLNVDMFRVGFDPYNTQQDAYIFEITASGVQYDYKVSDDTWDAVWHSAVQIDARGWSAELKIPYSAIRFPDKPEHVWGFQAGRTVRRYREISQWSLTPKKEDNYLAYWGRLTALRDIKAPLRLSFTPYLLAGYDRSPGISAEGSTIYSDAFVYSFGADMKYGIDDRFTIDMTLMPDFSQVQSDKKIKSLSYEEVTYSENRAFFKESTELFVKDNLFYSRRIGKTPSGYYRAFSQLGSGETMESNPSQVKLLNALKISGRNNNGLGIGFFNAITDNAYAEIKDSSGNRRKMLTEPLTNYNILVFDQQLKHNSSLYFINTSVIRDKGGSDANVSGAGLTLRNKKNTIALDASGAVSQKFTSDSLRSGVFENIIGAKWYAGVRKTGGNFQYGISHTYLGKRFDSRDMGYFVFGNKMQENLYLSYNLFNPAWILVNSSSTLSFDYGSNPLTGKPIMAQASLSSWSTLLDYTSLYLSFQISPFITYDYYEPRVPGRFSRNMRYFVANVFVSTDYRKRLAVDAGVTYARFINEGIAGDGYGFDPALRYRVNNHLQLKYLFECFFNTYDRGFAAINEANEVIFAGRDITTYSNGAEMRYMFKNDMALSLISRHYWSTGRYLEFFLLENDGSVTPVHDYEADPDFSFNAFTVDMIYSWQFAPGSLLTISYKNNIEAEQSLQTLNFARNFEQTLALPQQNLLSIKLLYYLDYLYLKKRDK